MVKSNRGGVVAHERVEGEGMLKEREDPTHSQPHAEILNDPLTIQIGDRYDGQLLLDANKTRVGTPARSRDTRHHHNCTIGFIVHSVQVDSTASVMWESDGPKYTARERAAKSTRSNAIDRLIRRIASGPRGDITRTYLGSTFTLCRAARGGD